MLDLSQGSIDPVAMSYVERMPADTKSVRVIFHSCFVVVRLTGLRLTEGRRFLKARKKLEKVYEVSPMVSAHHYPNVLVASN